MTARSDLSEPAAARKPLRSRAISRALLALKTSSSAVRDKFPLTARGVGLGMSATGGLAWLGYGALDQVWYVAGLGLLALVSLTIVLVLAATLRVWLPLRRQAVGESASKEPIESQRVDTRATCLTGYRFSRLRFWPLVEVRLSIAAPDYVRADAAAAGPYAVERITVDDHGELRNLTRLIEIRDVFGLASIRLKRPGTVDVDVLPHAGALRSLPMLRSLAGGDDLPHPMGLLAGDRLDLRRYGPGDPARFIHWKVYARTQKLVVRVPERALSRAHRVAAFLVAGARDGASAAVARVALEEGAFGDDFRFGADGTATASDRIADALTALRRSAHARASGGKGLAGFLDTVEREGPVSLLLFVPAKLGAEYGAIRDLLSRRARPPRVVIGVDGIDSIALEPLWKRATLLPSSHVRIGAVELKATLAAYRKLGAEVVIFDRESGRVLSEAHFANLETREEAA